MRRSGFTDWAERRAHRQGSGVYIGRALLATLWAMIGGPILWVLFMPIVGKSADAVLYALLLALVGSFAGYAITLFLFRRWSRG